MSDPRPAASSTQPPRTLPAVTCPECGRDVPHGEFCGACGTSLVDGSPGAAERTHAFAANPAEHVLHLSVVSTLFPHLPHRRTAPFRVAFLVAGALLALLGFTRLVAPAVALAAFAVPALYLLYLYEVEVYESEPARVIGLTFVLGFVLGVPWALLTGPVVSRTLLENVSQGVSPGKTLLAGMLFPLLAQALMLVGAVIIYRTMRFDDGLDGFIFGAGGALGFTCATTLVELWPDLQAGLFSDVPALVNALDITLRGLLVPFLNASTAGLIGGALWMRLVRRRATVRRPWVTSLPVAIAIAALAQATLGLVGVYRSSAVFTVLAYAVVVALLLLWVRIAIHFMLLAEAADVRVGPDVTCAHCHRVVPQMPFCPHCGIARQAQPKTALVGQPVPAVPPAQPAAG